MRTTKWYYIITELPTTIKARYNGWGAGMGFFAHHIYLLFHNHQKKQLEEKS
jgi:hypothetical protein